MELKISILFGGWYCLYCLLIAKLLWSCRIQLMARNKGGFLLIISDVISPQSVPLPSPSIHLSTCLPHKNPRLDQENNSICSIH